MRFHFVLFLAFSIVASSAGEDRLSPRPVIDVHLHAGPIDWTGPGMPSDPANDDHLRNVLSQMDRYNVRLATISGPMDFVEYWKKRRQNALLLQ
jgi:hypothetical protein